STPVKISVLGWTDCADAAVTNREKMRDAIPPAPLARSQAPTTFPRRPHMVDTRRRIGRDYASSSGCGLRQVRQPCDVQLSAPQSQVEIWRVKRDLFYTCAKNAT